LSMVEKFNERDLDHSLDQAIMAYWQADTSMERIMGHVQQPDTSVHDTNEHVYFRSQVLDLQDQDLQEDQDLDLQEDQDLDLQEDQDLDLQEDQDLQDLHLQDLDHQG
jgi:hypothetical protein